MPFCAIATLLTASTVARTASMPAEKHDEAFVTSHDITTNDNSGLRPAHLDEKKGTTEVNADIIPASDGESGSEVEGEVIIRTGADAAVHLLPLRDDGDPSLTFRGILLATALTGFQATMNQIYQV